MTNARCHDCNYVLDNLSAGTCPGCGRPFDPNDPKSLDVGPTYRPFRYWLPGYLLALGAGAVFYPLLIFTAGYGYAVSLVLPFCIGALIGYGCRVSKFLLVLLALIGLAGLTAGLYSVSVVGVFCGLVMAGVALGPLILGTLAGAALRTVLKQTDFSQRWHLPVISLLLAPLVVGAIEAHFAVPFPDETISTTIILPVSVDRAWDAVMFYEEINLPPPLLMRIALPRPLYTQGSIEHVGDRKVCVYSHGRLVKVVMQRVVNKTLAFEVVEQTNLENHSIRLKSGSFEFIPLGADQTEITLVSNYQPLLGPRWVWRWSERIGFHTLHGYVLEGMRAKAIADAKKMKPIQKPPPPDNGTPGDAPSGAAQAS